MAKVWFNPSSNRIEWREGDSPEPMQTVPEQISNVIEFDDDSTVGKAIVSDLYQNFPLYSIVGSELRKNNIAVVLPPDGDRIALKKAASNALLANATFLALSSPSNAQVLAQVKLLTQENSQIIKRLLQLDKVV